MRFFLFALFFIANLSFYSVGLKADTQDPKNSTLRSTNTAIFSTSLEKEITLDGRSYDGFDLIRDFLNVSFSTTLWNENAEDYFSKTFPAYVHRLAGAPTKEDIQRLHSGYIYPEWVKAQYAAINGNYPKFGVINKWETSEIDVAIGWPRALVNENSKERRLASLVEGQVKHLAPQIKAVAGLNLNFLKPDNPKENSPSYARIRIVFSPMYDGFFKTLPGLSASRILLGGGKDKAAETDLYWGAVTFTPYSRSNVDGYFLPNTDNNIDLAVCRVSPFLPEGMLKALIGECLLRSLGLSDLSKINQDSLSGRWNREYDQSSKNLASEPSFLENIENFDSLSPLREVDFKLLGTAFLGYQSFTQYDLQMLKLLYCPDIKPGMDKYQVIYVLSRNSSCIY